MGAQAYLFVGQRQFTPSVSEAIYTVVKPNSGNGFHINCGDKKNPAWAG